MYSGLSYRKKYKMILEKIRNKFSCPQRFKVQGVMSMSFKAYSTIINANLNSEVE